ncbi:branched-chain amino acid ABC transporter permease [Microaerobacter geothermalis]|uniref:branched-chain amino acid ABC transporter permease n=1 Tax=Microaerobacter geothermalis TaxID=674972 RepID=UPI001F334AC2|nr:branched-chain amino acid ABC transporter permease [Microaerobacter geothermalis]MCF6093934.1 branched-chain amino acid ABC transporter permease [Microaerobacter geothermalis]
MIDTILNPYYLQIFSFILINIILGISIYITLATGQLSLGNAGFMAIGAYTSAILTIKFSAPMPVGIVSGAILAGIAGVLVGIPTLRLKGVYLAIATLGFGEVVRVLLNNWEYTNGASGLPGIPQIGREIAGLLKGLGITAKDLGLKANQLTNLIIVLVLLVIVVFLVWFFVRQSQSRVGRAYSSICADEDAAEAMGIYTTYYKILAFSQGAFVAGLAGALYAHTTTFINPADFSYHRAVEILIFAVFGGSEVIIGPIFGAAFLTSLPEVLRSASDYRLLIYGALIVLMMAVRPQGLIDVQLIRWIKDKFSSSKSSSANKGFNQDRKEEA